MILVMLKLHQTCIIYLFIKGINIACLAGSQLTSMKKTQYLQFADQQEQTVANINLLSLMGQGHVKVWQMLLFQVSISINSCFRVV